MLVVPPDRTNLTLRMTGGCEKTPANFNLIAARVSVISHRGVVTPEIRIFEREYEYHERSQGTHCGEMIAVRIGSSAWNETKRRQTIDRSAQRN